MNSRFCAICNPFLVLGLVLLSCTPLFAQDDVFFQKAHLVDLNSETTLTGEKVKHVATSFSPKLAADADNSLYYAYDFGNGLNDPSGAWTTGGSQGAYWFITYPAEDPNGYQPLSPLPGNTPYGNILANLFGTREVLNSPTRSNGVLMLDMDRYNSTRTTPGQSALNHILEEPILAWVASPSIDLTGKAATELRFHQYTRLCCNIDVEAFVDLSTDGGATWPHAIPVYSSFGGSSNVEIEGEVVLQLGPYLGLADDLSNVQIRFRMDDGVSSHYFWMVDDIEMGASPANDLVASTTWHAFSDRNEASFAAEDITSLEYYRNVIYQETPAYTKHPLNLAMEVTNVGALIQHQAALTVEMTSPNGQIHTFTSVPKDIPQFVIDTLTIDPIMPGDDFPVMPGTYTLSYMVSQTQEDGNPSNNQGAERSFRISATEPIDDIDTEVFQKNADAIDGFSSFFSNDALWNVPFAFEEPEVGYIEIIAVEAVFVSFSGIDVFTVPDIVNYNVRLGSIADAFSGNPEQETTLAFPNFSPFYNPSLEHIIDEDMIWIGGVSEPLLWSTMELPEPVVVDPNQIYGAEIFIPEMPFANIYVGMTVTPESYNAYAYSFLVEDWYLFGASPAIRFRTRLVCPETDEVQASACGSYEFYGTEYTASGTYEQTVEHAEGCTVTYTLDLTIGDEVLLTFEEEVTACGGYGFYSEWLTASGTYTHQFSNETGCDSLITLDLIVNQHTASSLSMEGCGEILFADSSYTAGTHQVILTNQAGCDSVVTLYATVLPVYDEMTSVVSCFPYSFQGTTYSETTQEVFAFSSVAGCDSTLTLDYTRLDNADPQCACGIGQLNMSDLDGNAVEGWCPEEEIVFSITGDVDVPLGGQLGLRMASQPSGPEVLVAVGSFPVSLLHEGAGFLATDALTGEEYTLEGATEITPVVYDSSASDLSGICATAAMGSPLLIFNYENAPAGVCLLASLDAQPMADWLVWPNPAQGWIRIAYEGGTPHFSKIAIFDLTGRLLVAQHFAQDEEIDVSRLTSGVYIVRVRYGGDYYTKRLVIQR